MDTLDVASRIQPLTPAGIYREADYYVWGPNLSAGDDGKTYMVYSRWPRATKLGGWLTDSEVALAVADAPRGPYTHVKTLLKGRGPGHWDELMAHNPKLTRFGDKYYLYHISSRQGPTRGHIRYSQRTGVAVADSILGPYERLEQPIIEPANPVYNVTVNPGITEMPDGRYLLIVKGDIEPREPVESFPQRVQALAIGDSPTGPFRLQPTPAIADIDTEDASIWYDVKRQVFYAVFHAHTYIGLIVSEDGISWRRAAHYTLTGKRLRLADGGVLEPKRLERPSVFCAEDEPRVLCLGAMFADDAWCLLVPLG